MAPATNLGAPSAASASRCCPCGSNVDQVGGPRGTEPEPSLLPAPASESQPPHSPQDALLFLRDFFTTLAASINPVVPAENSVEGEQLGRRGGGSGPPASPPCLGPSPVCPCRLLQLALRPWSPPAAPRKGSPGVGTTSSQRPQVVGNGVPHRAAHLLQVGHWAGDPEGQAARGQARRVASGPLLLLPREFRFRLRCHLAGCHGKPSPWTRW